MSALIGAVLGLAICIGGALLFAGWSASKDPASRIIPMLRVAEPAVDSKPRSPGPKRFTLINRHVLRVLDVMVSNDSVTRRLIAADRRVDVDRFRVEQLKWAAGGVVFVVAGAVLRVIGGGSISPMLLLVAAAIAAICGALLRDLMLTREAHARTAAICAQLPAVAELLAFTVAAGVGVNTSLGRVSSRVSGDFGDELERVCTQVAAGLPLVDALNEMADRVQAPAVQRFVDGIVTALERGTPIAEVLRAQAMDARMQGHTDLMEQAGRREISALFPVVFLILPVVVVVAVFPGFFGLIVRA